MNDALLTSQDKEEALSRVYVQAVAAAAGYITAEPAFDRDSVDIQIKAGGSMRPALDLQLKATINLRELAGGNFSFKLPIGNYNDLRCVTLIPRLLVVLELPRDDNRWLTISADKLVVRRRAYWLNLRGFEATENKASVAVRIPRQNLFNVESLRALMGQAREGIIR